MRLNYLALGLAAVIGAVATTQAGDGIFVPLFPYRTGAFAGSGIPIALNKYSTASPARLIVAQKVIRIRMVMGVPKYFR